MVTEKTRLTNMWLELMNWCKEQDQDLWIDNEMRKLNR